jgi:lysophospholipase L1-like esterase
VPRLLATRFIAFGDSMTWGEDGADVPGECAGVLLAHRKVQLPPAQTYPGALLALMATRYTEQSLAVLNAGNPGEAVLGTDTLTRFITVLSTHPADVVLLMEGANDLGDQDLAAVIAGLANMIVYAKSHGLRVLLATIPPENPAGICPTDRGTNAGVVATFNAQVRQLAVQESVPLVDVERAFNGDFSLIGPDGLHPNTAGYRAIAAAFFTSIEGTIESHLSLLLRHDAQRGLVHHDGADIGLLEDHVDGRDRSHTLERQADDPRSWIDLGRELHERGSSA